MSKNNRKKRQKGQTEEKQSNKSNQSNPASPPVSITQRQGNQGSNGYPDQHNQSPNYPERWRYPRISLINILTLLLVLVGIATVYVLAVGQRAAIHLASLKTNNFLLPDTNISAVMEFDNTGQIDGRIVATCMIFNSGESLPNVPIITDPIGGNGCKSQNNVVIPNGKTVIRHGVVMYMGRAIVRLTPQALTQIYGGKRKAFTWGIAEYRDQYSFILGPKTTGFCRVLTGNPVNVTWESCGLSAYEY